MGESVKCLEGEFAEWYGCARVDEQLQTPGQQSVAHLLGVVACFVRHGLDHLDVAPTKRATERRL
jgi:hypothetical protein